MIMIINFDEFVSDVSSKKLKFEPLGRNVSEALCKALDVDYENWTRECHQ